MEALLGLALTGIVGLAAVHASGQAVHTLREVLRREAEVRRASSLLERLASADAAELRALVGRHTSGSHVIDVGVAGDGVYRVTVAPLVAPGQFVTTVVARQVPPDGRP